MTIRGIFFWVCALLLCDLSQGQNTLSLEKPEWSEYPKYQFEFWTRDRHKLKGEKLQFKANGKKVQFHVDSTWIDDGAIEMDFFFLVENSPRLDYPEQLRFFQSLMSEVFFLWNPPNGSRYYLADFDRKVSGKDCVRWSDESGTTSLKKLSSWLEAIEIPPNGNEVLENRRPESRMALFDAVQFAADVSNSDGNRRQALILLSRENSDPFVASPTPLEIITAARANDIAVYSISAPMPEDSRWQRYRTEIHQVADKTFGNEISAADGKYAIVDFLNEIKPNHAGFRALLSSELEVSNPLVPTDLVVSYFGEQSVVVLGPVGTWTWLRSYPKRMGLFFGTIFMVFLLLMGSTFWIVHNRKKERQLRAQELSQVEQKLQEQASQSSRELLALRRESDLLKSDRLAREREEREKDRADRKLEYDRQRLQRFSALQRNPSLLVSVGGREVIHRIDVRIGRISSDIVLSDDTVSKQHAEISFQIPSSEKDSWNHTEGFYIRDLNSTNGTFVNGRQIRGEGLHFKLQDGDVIALGNVLLTFKT